MALEINATDLHRIMGCGGFLELAPHAIADKITDDRLEGIAAHGVFKYVLNGMVSTAEELVDRNINGYIVTAEMVEHIIPHIEHIQRRGLTVLSEEKLNWATPTGGIINCRADVVSYDEMTQTLYIDDPKYGWKIVEPHHNWQMIAYAIGAMVTHKWPALNIVMTIHQPRPFHGSGPVREWIIDARAIQQFYQQIVDRLVTLPDTVTTGPHCYKCDRAYACPASRMAALAAVDITTGAYSEDLTALQISYELNLLDRAQEALKVRLDALKSLATSKGGVPGWAMKQSYGNRKWIEGADAETLSMLGGVAVEALQKLSLITPSQAEKVGVPKEVVSGWTDRPSRGFNLVRADTDKDAQKLFNQQ